MNVPVNMDDMNVPVNMDDMNVPVNYIESFYIEMKNKNIMDEVNNHDNQTIIKGNDMNNILV